MTPKNDRDRFARHHATKRPAPSTKGHTSDYYKSPEIEPLKLADLVLYPERSEVYRGKEKIPLRRKEYQLLEFMMRNQHRVLNRHTLLEYIWNYSVEVETNTLDVHMSALRKKVDGKNLKKLLRTVHGAGYKLSDQ